MSHPAEQVVLYAKCLYLFLITAQTSRHDGGVPGMFCHITIGSHVDADYSRYNDTKLACAYVFNGLRLHDNAVQCADGPLLLAEEPDAIVRLKDRIYPKRHTHR